MPGTASSSRSSPQNTSPRATKSARRKCRAHALRRSRRRRRARSPRTPRAGSRGAGPRRSRASCRTGSAPCRIPAARRTSAGRSRAHSPRTSLPARRRPRRDWRDRNSSAGRAPRPRTRSRTSRRAGAGRATYMRASSASARPVVHLDHDRPHRERPPHEADVGHVLHAVDPHHVRNVYMLPMENQKSIGSDCGMTSPAARA